MDYMITPCENTAIPIDKRLSEAGTLRLSRRAFNIHYVDAGKTIKKSPKTSDAHGELHSPSGTLRSWGATHEIQVPSVVGRVDHVSTRMYVSVSVSAHEVEVCISSTQKGDHDASDNKSVL